MKQQDFENAFGRAPDTFELAMRRALREDVKVRKIGIRGLLIAAILVVLMIGTAFAATRGFGLLDMIADRLPTNEQAQDMVQDVPVNHAEEQDFTVTIEQAISDGLQVFFTARVSPKDPGKTLFIPWAEQSTNEVEGLGKSYAQLAKEENKQLFVISAHNSWTGDLDFYEPGEENSKRDGNDLVISYAIPAVPDEGNDGKLTIHCSVTGYELYEGAKDRDSWQRVVAEAQIDYTKDIHGYLWENPAGVKEMGIALSSVRMYDSPVNRVLEVRTHVLPGLDEADQVRAEQARIQILNENGKIREIESMMTYVDEDTGERVMELELPASNEGLTIAVYDSMSEKPASTLKLALKDAAPIDMAALMKENADRLKAEAVEVAEERARWKAEEQARLSATPKPIPPDAKQVQLTGAEIPVLREEKTSFVGLVDRIESISGQVGLSATSGQYEITIDQVTASDSAMMVFYTFRSEKPLQRNEDPSIKGWDAKSVTPMLMDARIDNNPEEWSGLTDNANYRELFFVDDYTIRGYLILNSAFESKRLPEKCYITLVCAGFHTHDDSLKVSFMLDRSAANAGIIEHDLDIDASFSLPAYPGKAANVRLTHIAQSPFITTLDAIETLVENMNTQYVVRDDKGRFLRSTIGLNGYMYDAIDEDHPVIEDKQWTIWGAQDAESLVLIPVVDYINDGSAQDRHMPIDEPLPYTIETASGIKATILELAIDTKGMTVRYEGMVGDSSQFYLSKDQSGEIDRALPGAVISESTDPVSNITTVVVRWTPQKGAEEGERIKQSTLDKYNHLRIPEIDYLILDESQAVTVTIK